MLDDEAYDDLDARLAPVDARLTQRYPGLPHARQPVHTLYVPADLFGRGVLREYSRVVLSLVRDHGPLPFSDEVNARVLAKLAAEPVEDLRIDFEDGYGVRSDDEEDGHARATATAVANGERPAFVGLRCKSLEAPTRRRATRTLDVFLDALGPPPPGFVITLPKVSDPAQVEAMVVLCGRLEKGYGLAHASLRFEVQIETPPAILGADGTATVARLITAAQGRCIGLHYGTYDYSASVGIAAQYQSLEHPAADHAKAVMQVAAAGTGVRVCDGSTNVIPVGSTSDVQAAWDLHARLVRRSLERGFYQGWDLNPAQLPSRYGATYTFFREGARGASERLGLYLSRRSAGILDEPATARAMAGFLLRGLDCGALDADEVHFDRSTLEGL
ncbi:MAG TPA: aldolase/citrate lyase family protein [Micromonosporaceae bacterium]|jgi:citrate lyase beta subunit